MKYFVVKQTRYLLVQANTEHEALNVYSERRKEMKEMRAAAICTHRDAIEADTDWQAWNEAERLGVDRI